MEWIKCSDRLPPKAGYHECKSYMIFCGYTMIAYWYNNHWVDCCDVAFPHEYHPTHWMEMPPNPSEESDCHTSQENNS